MKADSDLLGETVKAVSIGLNSADVSYSLQIYKNPTDASNPTSGTPMLSVPQTGQTSHAGYYTIPLNSPFDVEEGDKIAVVFTNNGNDTINYFVDKEFSWDWLEGKTTQDINQSLRKYGPTNPWSDLFGQGSTARIHMFTDNMGYRGNIFSLTGTQNGKRNWYLQENHILTGTVSNNEYETPIVITIDDVNTKSYANADSNLYIDSISMNIMDGSALWFGGTTPNSGTFTPRESDGRYIANICSGTQTGEVEASLVLQFKTDTFVPQHIRGKQISQNVVLYVDDAAPTLDYSDFTINRMSARGVALPISTVSGTTLKQDSMIITDADNKTVSGMSIVLDQGVYYIRTTSDASIINDADYYISGYINDSVKDILFRLPVTISIIDTYPTTDDVTLSVPDLDYFYHFTQEPIQLQTTDEYKVESVTMEPYSGYTSAQKEVVNDNFGLEAISANGIITGYRIVVKNNLLQAEDLLDHIIVTEKGFLNKVDFKIICKGYDASHAVTKTVALDFVNGKSKVNTERTTFHLNNSNAVNKYATVLQVTAKNDPAQAVLDVFGTDSTGNCSVMIPNNDAAKKLYKQTVSSSYVAGEPMDVTKGPLNFIIEPKDGTHDNRFVISASKDTPLGTYVYKLIPKTEIMTGSGIHRALDSLNITVKIDHIEPEVKLQAQTLTLNGYYPSVSASTVLVPSTSIEYAPFETSWITVKSKPKASMSDDDVSLRVQTDESNSSGKVYANIRYGAPAGTYKFQITPRIVGVNGNDIESGAIALKPVTLSVHVKNTLPKVTLSQKSFTADNAFCEQEYRIEMTASGEYDKFADSSQIYRSKKGDDSVITTPLSAKEPTIRIVSENIYVKMNPETMKGTYRYYIAPALKIDSVESDITETTRQELVIKVTSTRPTAIPSKKVIKLERLYASGTEGAVQFSTKTTGLEFADYEAKCIAKPRTASGNEIRFEKDAQNSSKLTAKLCEANAPNGSYKFSITPKVTMKIRGVQYGNGENSPISLAPVIVTVKLSSNVPKFKMETSTAKLYRKYGNVSRLRILDSLNALADDAQKITYYLVKLKGKYKLTSDASLADTAYAIVTSEENGDIVVQKGANINSLSKAVTIKNLTVNRTLKLKQNAVSSTSAIADKRKIAITIYPEVKEPVIRFSKSKLVLNRYFDFDSEGLLENRIEVSTTAAAKSWTGADEDVYGAYITDCSAKVVKVPKGGSINDLQIAMDYESGSGTSGSVMLRAIPKESAVMGEYRVEVGATVNEYPVGHPNYTSSKNVPLTKKVYKIILNSTKQKVTYSAKKATVNRYEKNDSEVIELSIPGRKRYSVVASEIELTRCPKGNTSNVWVTQESEDGSCYLTINHKTSATAGNYEFAVIPKVTTSSGSYTAAKQKIVIKVVATYPKAAFLPGKLKIKLATSKADRPSATTKVVYSGALASQIENADYTYEAISRPKKENDANAVILQAQGNNITAICRDKSITPGTYKFRLTPTLHSTDVAYPTIKPITLTVTVSKK